MSEPLHISPDDLAASDDRFDRFRLIGWWDQDRLRNARVLVIGAGALGNEIIKNLALLGVGHVVIADKDTIENSNLSRSVLYRAHDAGKHKSVVAAESARDIYPDIKVKPLNCDIVHDLGTGVYRWADLVIGGLDNREARLSINRQCWRVGKPWIDGAIEVIQGIARVFIPDNDQQNPCYECTMSERDWKVLQHRKSCNLLTRDEMETGRVPTTPTIASIIAGVQTQEAVKLLHDLPTLTGKAFVFAGDSGESYTIEYQRKPDCYSHDTLQQIVDIDTPSSELTMASLFQLAKVELGAHVIIDLHRDIARSLHCTSCQKAEDVFRSLGALHTSDARCPHCQKDAREVITFNTIRGDEPFLNRTVAGLGIPAFDILTARSPDRSVGLQLAGDAPGLLGELWQDEIEL
jgi:adenylyltransferase/sulfurtransferase